MFVSAFMVIKIIKILPYVNLSVSIHVLMVNVRLPRYVPAMRALHFSTAVKRFVRPPVKVSTVPMVIVIRIINVFVILVMFSMKPKNPVYPLAMNPVKMAFALSLMNVLVMLVMFYL